MPKQLSIEHSKLTFDEKARLSETREKIVAKELGWNRIGHQWVNGTSDMVTPTKEHDRAEMKTDFRMDETGRYFLSMKDWDKQSSSNKYWVVCQAGRSFEQVDIAWVVETSSILADLPKFEAINVHDGGYFIPIDWLDFHAVKKLTFS